MAAIQITFNLNIMYSCHGLGISRHRFIVPDCEDVYFCCKNYLTFMAIFLWIDLLLETWHFLGTCALPSLFSPEGYHNLKTTTHAWSQEKFTKWKLMSGIIWTDRLDNIIAHHDDDYNVYRPLLSYILLWKMLKKYKHRLQRRVNRLFLSKEQNWVQGGGLETSLVFTLIEL